MGYDLYVRRAGETSEELDRRIDADDARDEEWFGANNRTMRELLEAMRSAGVFEKVRFEPFASNSGFHVSAEEAATIVGIMRGTPLASVVDDPGDQELIGLLESLIAFFEVAAREGGLEVW